MTHHQLKNMDITGFREPFMETMMEGSWGFIKRMYSDIDGKQGCYWGLINDRKVKVVPTTDK